MDKAKLRRIIRKILNESDIYPRPQHPMIANAGKELESQRFDTIADTLCDITGLTPDVCDKAAEAILAALKRDGLY